MAMLPVLPADGEKLSTEQIGTTHVPHPGLGKSFKRSTLLIGTRGVGKTFLLRHRKQSTHPGAVYVNLVSCLQSLSRDAGLGGRALKYSADLSSQINAKTAALVAIAVVEQLVRDVNLNQKELRLEYLSPVLADPVIKTGVATLSSLEELRLSVNRLRLREWPTNMDVMWPLIDVLSKLNQDRSHPLALFLDRAEDVAAPALQTLLPLLDQSVEFLVVIAARPGLAQLIPARIDPTLVPGDHFDIVHLGADPYDEDWISFSVTAVRNFLEANDVHFARSEALEWASLLGRDSVRSAINLAQLTLGLKEQADVAKRAARIAAHRDQRLATITAVLRPDNPNFAKTIKAIQRNFREQLKYGPHKPVLIEVESSDEQLSLLLNRSTMTEFLLKAIRCEALFLPPGHLWHPLELPSMFEVPPLLAWNGENIEWIS